MRPQVCLLQGRTAEALVSTLVTATSCSLCTAVCQALTKRPLCLCLQCILELCLLPVHVPGILACVKGMPTRA